MAIKQSVNFALQLRGDGTGTSITVALTTAPISYYAPNGQAIQPGFVITSLLPTSVSNLSCSDGTLVSSASLNLLDLTVAINFATPLADGTDPTVYGTLVF